MWDESPATDIFLKILTELFSIEKLLQIVLYFIDNFIPFYTDLFI